ncbi:MAG: hypothetical protein B7Z73_01595, partial [Planctomycetia bacterium 21-64-5]
MSRFASFLAGAALVGAAVVLAPSAASAGTPVAGLAACPHSHACDYGPIGHVFPDYASLCSEEDCNFIAAANWEGVAAGVTPSVALLMVDYADDHQTFGGGLSMPALWAYWRSRGLDGRYLTAVRNVGLTRARVESEVYAHRAIIARDVTNTPSDVGVQRFGAGTALLIVDGYTPKGPLVVYQGRTMQMTWAQWRAQARAAWLPTVTTTPSGGGPATPPGAYPVTATVTASPEEIPASGGTLTLTLTSTGATTCTLSASPQFTEGVQNVPCVGPHSVDVPASSSGASGVITFTFTATSPSGASATATVSVTQVASVAPAPTASSNWSGYVVPSSSALITEAAGQWTVPTLDCAATPAGHVATWVGIGGVAWATGGSSGALLQTGVDSACSGGV